MNIFKGLRNVINLAAAVGNDIPMLNMLAARNMGFMRWSGNSCSPGYIIDLTNNDGLEKAYKDCPPLSNVIGRNAKAYANAKFWIVDEEDNDVKERYKGLVNLMKSPNPLQSWLELQIQFDTYRQLYGEAFLWAVTPVGYENDNKEAQSIWAIKPSRIFTELTNKMYLQYDIEGIVKNYFMYIGNEKIELDKRNILHVRDTFQNLNFNENSIRGNSRAAGLHYPIRNIIQAYEAIYSLNKDRGPQGLLSSQKKDDAGTVPLTKPEKEELQKAFSNYGLSERQKKVIISDVPMDWTSMSYNVRDLMLFDGIRNNIEQIADTYEYPFELLANGSTTGSNLSNGHNNEAKKRHYQDNIIPLANLYTEKFTEFFGLQNGDRVIADYSDVECLREAEKETASTLSIKAKGLQSAFENGIISQEEYRLALGYDENIYGRNMYDGKKDNQ